MAEPFIPPATNKNDKYEKKEVDRDVPEKPRESGEAIPEKGEAPEHEGAMEEEVGDRKGSGPGFDQEPEKVDDAGGVAPS